LTICVFVQVICAFEDRNSCRFVCEVVGQLPFVLEARCPVMLVKSNLFKGRGF